MPDELDEWIEKQRKDNTASGPTTTDPRFEKILKSYNKRVEKGPPDPPEWAQNMKHEAMQEAKLEADMEREAMWGG